MFLNLILAGLSVQKFSVIGMFGAQGLMLIIFVILKLSGVLGFITGLLKLLNWIGILK